MAISLKPQHLKRYRDMARLLAKYGRSDLVREAGLDDALEPGDAVDPDAPPPEAEQLAADLEAMGPTFIKLGQLLSTRADLLPAPYLQALTRLQDDVEPMSFAIVEETVERELGVRIHDAFSFFDHVPLASASLGQVHRAALRDGRPVAVKVQRPEARQCIEDDMAALADVAEFLDRRTEWGRRYGFAEMLEEFRQTLMRELDYRIEAQNLVTLGHNLAGLERIEVPQPVADYTSARVLTMDFVGGRKITSLGPLALMEIDGHGLADALFRAYLKQILEDGFFHADPHPGNVFITDAGNLALLDLGMVARVQPRTQDDLVKLLLAVSEGRGDEAADVAIELGERRDVFEEDRFRREVSGLVADHQGLSLEQIHAGSIVAELTRISGECGLRPAPELTMLGKALLNLDEVARRLDPEFDPNAAIQEQAARLLRNRMLKSASPANLFSAAIDAKEFAEKLPGRVNKVMDALAEGQLTLNVQGIDEQKLLKGIHRVANRLTTGLILAALILGASMLMSVKTKQQLFGYPALAIICFMAAAVGGAALLVTIFISDRE
ncbi:MAG: ubiquinone biosynthesis protein [Actinomycetota bacterium]|nr:ubiquinone biosynthesis protein [Actinomycetota bacterium]